MSDNVHELKVKLYEIITKLNDLDTVEDFLKDLCTNKEIEQMAQRIRAAELIREGKTYNQIQEELDISSATIARVSQALKYGKGYKKFIK
ncbi:MAG: helix-turn-helix domain-containing protein [Clostridia bacterium]|nr:helix-turn-helix domain-containing protein [Clostridia bacterium]